MKRRHFLVDDSIYPVFITTTITKWIPVFSNQTFTVRSLEILESIRQKHKAVVIGYVLMPNHFHCIIKTAVKGDLSIIVKAWKAQCARFVIDGCRLDYPGWLAVFRAASIEYGRSSPMKYQVWQPRFDEFAIRNREQLRVKLNYIHGNPMKHHLVENADDYPYSSIHDYLGNKNQYLKIDLVDV